MISLPLLPAAIVAEARSWLGTPFVHGAAIKGVGVDCVQLSRAVYMAVAVAPPDFPDFLPYPTGWLLERGDMRYRDAIATHMTPVWVDGAPTTPVAAPGDLALFRIGRAAAHSAIVTTWPLVIHAWDEDCVVEVSGTTNVLRARPLVSLWRPTVLCG